MKNPLMQAMSRGNNPVGMMLQFMQGGGNPMQLANTILQKNPQAQNILNQMKAQCGDKNPRDFALEMCRQQGGDPNQLLQLAQKLGVQ